jgi:hypothetical protein
MHRLVLAALSSLALATAASAQSSDGAQPDLEVSLGTPPARGQAGNGGWLFSDSTRVPSPGSAAVITRLTYSASDSPTRPFASNVGSPGTMAELGGELGLLPGLSLQAVGVQGTSFKTGATASGAIAGMRYSLLPAGWNTQVVVSGGWLHELNARSNGAWGRVQLGWERGALRTSVAVHGEHVFNTGRDGVDLMVTAGASLRMLEWLRAGVEYVGQDLEETFGDEAEGGARHMVGPTAALTLLQDKLSVVAGPAVAFAPEGRKLLGRMALSYAF